MFSLVRHCWLFVLLFCAYTSEYLIQHLSIWWLRSRMGLIGSAMFQSIGWVPLVVCALLLLFICRKDRVERGFTFYFGFCLPLLVLLICTEWMQIFPGSKWMILLVYFGAQITKVIPIILFWGWANRHNHFSTAAWLYPFFAVIPLSIPVIVDSGVFLKNVSVYQFLTLLGLQALMAVCFFSGNSFFTLKPTPRPASIAWITVSVAAILISLGIGSYFLEMSFKWQARLAFPEWAAYKQFIVHLALLKFRWTFILFGVSLLLGGYLAITGQRQLASVILLFQWVAIASAGMVAYAAQRGTISGYDAIEVAWIGLGLFRAVRTLLDTVFLELGFILLPMRRRFTVKLWVDLVLAPMIVPCITGMWWWIARAHDWLRDPPPSIWVAAGALAFGMGFIGALGLNWSASDRRVD